jgi:hypothetical protein
MYNVNPFYGQENSQSFSFKAAAIDAPFAALMSMFGGISVPRFDFGDGFASASTTIGNFALDKGHWFNNGATSSTVTISCARVDYINQFQYPTTYGLDGIYGELDISKWTRLYDEFTVTGHRQLTGMTFPSVMETDNEFLLFRAYSNNLQGHVELSGMTNIGRTTPNATTFQMYGNTGLTSVNFPATEKLVNYSFRSCGLSEVDLSMVSGYSGFDFGNNPTLSSITFTNSGQVHTIAGDINLYQCAFKDVDFTGLADKFGGRIELYSNPYLSAVTFPTTTATTSELQIQSCGFQEDGILDLRPLQNLGGYLVLRSNSFGEVLFPSNDTLITTFITRNLAQVKNVDLSPLSGINTSYNFNGSAKLTGMTFPTGNLYEITGINVASCDLRNLNMASLTGLSSSISIFQNNSMTAVTFPTTNYHITNFLGYQCDIRNLDFSPLSSYGGDSVFFSNSSLTAVTFPSTTGSVTSVHSYSCDLRELDLSPLGANSFNPINIGSSYSGVIWTQTNPNLTAVTLPPTTGTIVQYNSEDCNIGVVDFGILSGGNQDNIYINMDDNSTTFEEGNLILDSLVRMDATGGTLHLSGDSGSVTGAQGYDISSGGVNGYSIYTDLTTNSGWTIFMSGLTS